MDELEQRKRLDEERLRARRAEHERMLEAAADSFDAASLGAILSARTGPPRVRRV